MKKILTILAVVMAFVSCNKSNPFIEGWDTPYGIPPFAEIQEKHYLPAIEAGIKQQTEQIQAIIDNEEAPTFENVIVPFDNSGEILTRTTRVLFPLSSSDATDSFQAIVEKAIPKITEHSNNIYMNADLFAKVDALYQQQDALNLDREQTMVLKKIHRAFVNNGIALSAEDQARMKEINTELSSLEYKFGTNVLAENNAFAEKFGVTISEYTGEMTTCEDRTRREEMFKAYSSRGNNDNEHNNKELVKRIMTLRIEKANLLGYSNPADFILSDKMAGNAETVDNFLAEIIAPAVKKADEELVDMQKIMDEDIAAGKLLEDTEIEPWDWFYYAEKVRVAKYNLTEEETRPYFKMENVRQGVFTLANNLFGISVEPLEGIDVYHPEVEVFKVTDADGSHIGIFMTDFFPRPTKKGGAWMTSYLKQTVVNGEDIRPVIVNVGSFAKPTATTPSLLTLDQVGTLFHEFGHALHGLLSKCNYDAVSGTSVSRDFVELPSQIMENWAFLPEVLATYAFHYETGEVIPAELVEKINAASLFNQGFMTTELCAAAILDLKWHQLTSMEGIEIEDFEEDVCEAMNLNDEIIPRYRSTYFNHIFSGGYSAGYYSYLWAEVLDKDAFELFKENGVLDKETAMSFRHNILEKGGSEEPMTLYKQFRGAEPDASALLRGRGL